ncbi:MAG: hydroxyacid dehydrogenase [Actinomycetales bacterium]|nr:MAG: hydroxyacid dehydrogenase [Actinomycetales bacterium]
MKKILITSRSFSSGSLDLLEQLKAAGFEPKFADSKHDLTELAKELPSAIAWIAGTSEISADVMDLAPNLKIIARYGVGFESVDLSAARERGIVVTNTPGANSLAVAELTIGLAINALRAISTSAKQVRDANWSVVRGKQLEGSVVGIIGFGRIGRILAAKFKALGCDVWISDPFVNLKEITEAGFISKTVSEISTGAGIVSLNAPGDGAIVDKSWVTNAASGQVIINSARAELVDESAIADGLRSEKLFAYAADTLKGEKNSATSPLMADDISSKVTITAHLGAQTVEAVDLMGSMATANVLAILSGKPAINLVS